MEPNPTRHGLLLAAASASVTVAVAVTAGALTGYFHPPRAAEAPMASPPEAAPVPRTVLVPIRPDASAGERDEPGLLTVRADVRHARGERDDDDVHRRHRGEHDNDD